jgi:hypothetical protein
MVIDVAIKISIRIGGTGISMRNTPATTAKPNWTSVLLRNSIILKGLASPSWFFFTDFAVAVAVAMKSP